MTRIHNNEVKNIAECNLLHDIINPPKPDKIYISINLLFYMYVLILEKVKRSLKTFAFYFTVDVVLRL